MLAHADGGEVRSVNSRRRIVGVETADATEHFIPHTVNAGIARGFGLFDFGQSEQLAEEAARLVLTILGSSQL